MQAWLDFLKMQENRLGKVTVDKWLRSLKLTKYDACNIYLEAKDSFQVMWFEEQIRPLLKTCLLNNNNRPIQVHVQLENENKKTKRKRTGKEKLIIQPDEVDPTSSLFSFLPPEKSIMTFRLICELTGFNQEKKKVEKPKLKLGSFNPLYIYGPSGVGKTHLLMACAYSFKKQGYRTFFVKAQTFTDHVVNAIRLSQMDEFRKAYRNIDVLLVDDIHILARKNATQEEFFHTFNRLHQMGCQIILCANVPPSQLDDIEPRLISRFEWGLSLRLEKLDKSKTLKLLYTKAKEYNLNLKEETIQFIHSSFSSLVSMQKALEALILHTHLNEDHNPVNVESAKRYLLPLLEEETKSALSPDKIIRHVADFFGIKSEDILGKSQTRECSRPRQLAMYLCRHKLKIPFMKIGKIFSRDHSTVMTSIRSVQKMIGEKNRDVYMAYLDITKKLT